jgi:hypothetical protein
MRIAGLTIAVMVGLGCCVISLVDARVQQVTNIATMNAMAAEPNAPAPAHIMRGWRHGLHALPAGAEAATTAQ